MRFSLRSKLIVYIVGPLIVIATIGLWLTISKIYQYNIEQFHSRYISLARNHAVHLDDIFNVYAQSARYIAKVLEITGDIDEKKLLTATININPLIHGIAIAYAGDNVAEEFEVYVPYVFRNGDVVEYINLANRDDYDTDQKWEWYVATKKRGVPMWTEPYVLKSIDDAYVVSYMVPFYRDRTFAGVVSLDIDLELMEAYLDANEILQKPFIIISSKGNFITHPDKKILRSQNVFERVAGSADPDLAEITRDLLEGKAGVKKVNKITFIADQPMWVFYAPVKSTGWSYATALPEKDVLAFLKLQLTRGVVGIVLLLILIIISIFIVSTKITRPLSYFAGLVKQVGEGDFKLSVKDIKSDDEIGDLASAFSTMVEQLNFHVEERARESAHRKSVERELEIAREIQAALLPDNFPQCADQIKYDLYAVNAAAGHIGGDFYDFFNIDNGRFVFVIADVSGKGTPAAIIMAITKTLIRELARDHDSPAMLLRQVNRLLIEMHAQPVFVTMFIGIYEPDTGHILYANAGHQLPYVLEVDGNTRKFGETTGTIVGMIEDVEYEENREQLKVGEYLVAYTDGVTEARSSAGDFYGESHLVRFLSNCKELRTAEICELLIDDVSAFQSQQLSDDVTILVLNRCQ